MIPDGLAVLKVAKDERSEKSHFILPVKIKRQSSQSALLSAVFFTNVFCVHRNVHIFINITVKPKCLTTLLQLKNIN